MIPEIDDITKQTTFITSNFDEQVLYAPARTEIDNPCDSLRIITAFTDCERISTHMIKLSEGMKNNRFVKGIDVEILLGMTKSSLSQKKHEDIKRLIGFINEARDMPNITCRYICNGPEVHSKIYLWSHRDLYTPECAGRIPYRAYCGSLNYTMNAFYKRRESVAQCDSGGAFLYYEELLPDTIDCFDPLVTERLKNVVNNGPEDFVEPDNSERDYIKYDGENPIAAIEVSLLKADGSDTGYGSGINWGIRPDGTRRNQNQAYIPYNQQDKVHGFFPDRELPEDENCPMFKVITKDFGSFHMRMAQRGK